MKAFYSIEYTDEDGFTEVKKAFLTDAELRTLMDEFRLRGARATAYRHSPGPMPDPAVLSLNGRRENLELPDSDDK